MSALTFIWFVALSLTGAGVIVMLVLILARSVSDARRRRRNVQRGVLVRSLLAGNGAAEELKKLPSGLLTDTFMDLIRLVRGDERAAFVAQAVELGIPDRLGRRLRSPSARRRVTAAQSLAEFHDSRSLKALQASLDDINDDVRLAAALSLAEAGNTEEVHQLVEKLGLGRDEDSLMIVTLFRVIAEERPEQIKALVMNGTANPRVRLAGIEALATTGDYSLVPIIAQLAITSADDAEELPRYLRALGTLAHPAGREAVIHGLQRKAMGARAAAATAAGKIGLVESGPRLAKLLDDPEWWVRFRAAEALIRLGPPGLERLRQAAATGSPRARDAASTMLAERVDT